MIDLAPVKAVKSVTMEEPTGTLLLRCLLADETEQLIRLDPSAFSTWLAALHAVSGGPDRKHGFGMPLRPTGCRGFVLDADDEYGLAFRIRPGIELQMLFAPGALKVLKAKIIELEQLTRQSGNA